MRGRLAGRNLACGLLVFSLLYAPVMARAQVAAPKGRAPAPTIFSRKVEEERRIVMPTREASTVPAVRALRVRTPVRSFTPARRLRAVPVLAVAPSAASARVVEAVPSAKAPVSRAVPPTVPPAVAPAAPPAPASQAIAPRPATAQPRAGWAHVTYISGPSIYLDAGTRAGLKEGSRLEVVRGNNVIAELVVAYVSSTRSSCTVTTSSLPVAVGDSARFTPVREVIAQARRESPGADSVRRTAKSRATPNPIRGRLGVRYLAMQQDGGGASSTLTQPAFDLRLDGHNVNGTPFGLMVDVRAYRQNYTRTAGSTLSNSTRVYQTALLWNPANTGTRVALGRQFSTALSPVGLFDGVAIDVDRRHMSIGGFSGSQPDPRTFGYSGDVREHGAYVQWHNAPSGGATWAMTMGGIGSYAGGKIDREFGYLQGTFNNRYVSLYTAQEIDVNRGWKSDVESSGATPTSTFAMLRISPTDAFTVFAGYDNRRTVRLYRDFLNPEIAFDDSFRQGTWGGASLFLLGHLRLNGDLRTSRGGAAGEADSYTGSVHVTGLTPLRLGAQLRATRYTGALASGDLSAAAIEMRPFGSLRVELNGGRRSDTRASATLSNTGTTWWGADADVGLGRSLYLMASTYRETGEFQRNLQTMLALSLRF